MSAGQALDALYAKHAPSVFRRALRLLGSEAEAHDVVHDVFVSLLEQPDQYCGRSAVTTFMYSMTTHACLNRLRNQATRARLLRTHLQSSGDERDRKLSPEQLVTLYDLLARLPLELARVAVYHWFDDLTHDDIARLLGCSRRHVGDLLERVGQWSRAQEAV